MQSELQRLKEGKIKHIYLNPWFNQSMSRYKGHLLLVGKCSINQMNWDI